MVAGERFLMLSKTDGNSPTLCISRGRVYAHMRAHVQTNRKKHAHVRKIWGTCGCAQKKTGWWTVPDEKKQPRHGKVYPQSRTFFWRNGKKSLKKSVPPPEKIPDFPDLFPWTVSFMSSKEQKFPRNDHFYPSRRTKISRERPILCHLKDKNFLRKAIFCQPENKNFPRTASFMPAEGQKFREKDHFLPAKRQKFSENRHFFANRRTENSRKQPFLY